MPDLSPPEREILTVLRNWGGTISRDFVAVLPTETVGAIPRLVRRKLCGFDADGERFGLTAAGQVIVEEAL